jgi:hypothetical protein
MSYRFSIEHELRIAVELATQRLQCADREFSEYINDIPSGLPAPDGALRIRNAAEEKRIALATLQSAIERLNAFIY